MYMYITRSNLHVSCSMSDSGIVMMSIENLPAQIPREATDLFGSKLFPYIPDLVRNCHCIHTL